MKKIFLIALMSLCATICMAQANYLNTFVTTTWLNNFFQNNFQMQSGHYDEANGIFKQCTFVGNIPNWHVKVETNQNGRINNLSYSYQGIKRHSKMSNGNELLNMANRRFQDSSIKPIRKEFNNGNLYYEGRLRSTSSYRYKTIRITGKCSYNEYNEAFFSNYNVYFIMTGN